jgi:predicted DNA-binding protein
MQLALPSGVYRRWNRDMSKPTSIKTSEEVRDRLRILTDERGTTITELVEELATRELTAAEREQRAI